MNPGLRFRIQKFKQVEEQREFLLLNLESGRARTPQMWK
jgi:hypothetical protein